MTSQSLLNSHRSAIHNSSATSLVELNSVTLSSQKNAHAEKATSRPLSHAHSSRPTYPAATVMNNRSLFIAKLNNNVIAPAVRSKI